MATTIKTLADGRLGTALATLYSAPAGPSGHGAHAVISLANTNSANSYGASLYILRYGNPPLNGTSTARLLIGAGTLITVYSSSNTDSGRLILPGSGAVTGYKLAPGDSIQGSCTADNVVDYLITGGEET